MPKETIISAGGIYVDTLALDFPVVDGILPGKEVVGDKYELVAGGSALNFSRTCVPLDLKPTFIGKVGDDLMSWVLERLLDDSGIELALVKSPDVQTTLGHNYLSDAPTAMAVLGSANRLLAPEDVFSKLEEVLDTDSTLYLGSCFKLKNLMSSFPAIARLAHERGAKVAVDHGRFTNETSWQDVDSIRELLEQADYYFPSEGEFLSMMQVEDTGRGLDLLRKYSSATTIVKAAENGVLGLEGNTRVHVPAYNVRVINDVGAGDACNAGYLAAEVAGLTFEQRLQFACATAAIAISRNIKPNTDQVSAFMASNSR